MRISRLVHEVTSGVWQRAGRTWLTVLGITIGVASFITVLGLTSSANAQISATFLRADANRISVTATADSLPVDSAARAQKISGVQVAASSWTLTQVAERVSQAYTGSDSSQQVGVQVQAVDDSYWQLVGAKLLEGRVFDSSLRDAPVAVLGARAAGSLGITTVEGGPAVVVDGRYLTVIGIVDDVVGSPLALTSVNIPAGFARHYFGEPGLRETLVVQAQRGAAQVVSAQLAYAINPASTDTIRVVAPPAPTVVRDRVNAENRALYFALAGVCLLVSGVGISNVTLLGVLARKNEIALRRSLGALPKHIALQFLLESAVRGLLGGVAGVAVALLTVTLVCAIVRWTVVIEPWSFLFGPLLGLAVGLLAGVYPAVRATRVPPLEVFRE